MSWVVCFGCNAAGLALVVQLFMPLQLLMVH